MPNDLRAVRLIDAELLRGKLRPLDEKATLSSEWTLSGRDIEQAPTIDAVPVVRCKDCKHNPNIKAFNNCPCTYDTDDGEIFCTVMKDYDFCSRGEKV